MNLHITYLSSRSGSSVIVQINGNKYVFNVFEGFQRYMIEKKRSLKGIKAFFIPHEKSIPPFIGTYLTLRDGGAKTLNVVCSSHSSEIIEGANGFCPRNNLKLIYNSSYSDQYINAEIIYNHIVKGVKKEKIVYEDTDSSVVDFLLQIKNIRGSLIVDKIPEEIPKQYYSKLTKKEIFEHNGLEYNGKDYLEEDIEIGKIMFVFSEYKLEPLLEKIEEVRIIFWVHDQNTPALGKYTRIENF